MSGNGYLQLVFYVVVLIGAREAAGCLHGADLRRPAVAAEPHRRPVRARHLSCVRHRCVEGVRWVGYTVALLMFNLLGGLAVYGLQRLQASLPLNPAGMGAVSPDSSFNTAISFMTNTNWQGYGGESTMSYLSQMAGLGVQNFLSAATGMVVVIALMRGLARQSASDDRQFLGRYDAQRALHPAAAVVRARAGAGVARRRADVFRLSDRAAGRIGRIRQGASSTPPASR